MYSVDSLPIRKKMPCSLQFRSDFQSRHYNVCRNLVRVERARKLRIFCSSEYVCDVRIKLVDLRVASVVRSLGRSRRWLAGAGTAASARE